MRIMPISQNLRFMATVQKDTGFEHPPGAALMRSLASELAAVGWSADKPENWRDCGWSIGCRRGASELEVVVVQIKDGEWLLQVSPKITAGLIGRLFGSKPSASPGDVHAGSCGSWRAVYITVSGQAAVALGWSAR